MPNKFSTWKTAYHRATLEECLQTEREIEPENALLLVCSSAYKYYGYDERIKADRYLIQNMQKNLGLPQWIHEYKPKEEKK